MWVGIIALVGVAAEIGVIMLVYLDLAYSRWKDEGRLRNITDLISATVEATVQRVRPIIMTGGSTIAGLLPIMWSHGTGTDVMKRIAAPMIGGMFTTLILTLLVIPAINIIWRGWNLKKELTSTGWEDQQSSNNHE